MDEDEEEVADCDITDKDTDLPFEALDDDLRALVAWIRPAPWFGPPMYMNAPGDNGSPLVVIKKGKEND